MSNEFGWEDTVDFIWKDSGEFLWEYKNMIITLLNQSPITEIYKIGAKVQRQNVRKIHPKY